MAEHNRPPPELLEHAPLAAPDDIGERIAALGVTLDAGALALLCDYLGRLLAMNALMNLTAITDPAEVWSRHALDSLTTLAIASGPLRES